MTPQTPAALVATGQPAAGLRAGGGRDPAVVAFVWALAAVSALAAWVLVYAFFLSGLQEASAQHVLYGELRSELAQEIAPLGSHPAFGTPVAILRVPQAGIDDVVVEGTTSGVLEHGPGLLADTPLPGRPGWSTIYGRETMFGGPFRHLDVLRKGDKIQVTTGQSIFTYVVTSLQYPHTPEPPPLAAGHSRLTLVTVVGAGWRSAGVPDEVLYVNAMLRGKTVGSPAGLPTAVPPSQEAMHGDASVLLPLVLWLQLLLVTVIAVAWTRSRWGKWQTWLVGAPLILAVLWVVTDTAVQLFPNLL
jgi:sortase A